jgi:hypothetical protein
MGLRRMQWSRFSEQIFRIAKWSLCRGLGCHADGQRVEVGLIGCVAVKARVGPAAIVEVKIPADGSTSFADAVVGAHPGRTDHGGAIDPATMPTQPHA